MPSSPVFAPLEIGGREIGFAFLPFCTSTANRCNDVPCKGGGTALAPVEVRSSRHPRVLFSPSSSFFLFLFASPSRPPCPIAARPLGSLEISRVAGFRPLVPWSPPEPQNAILACRPACREPLSLVPLTRWPLADSLSWQLPLATKRRHVRNVTGIPQRGRRPTRDWH